MKKTQSKLKKKQVTPGTHEIDALNQLTIKNQKLTKTK